MRSCRVEENEPLLISWRFFRIDAYKVGSVEWMIGVPNGLFVAKSKAFSSLYPKGMRVLQNKCAKSGASSHYVDGNFVGL
eukprot:5773041-Heterocapsa_arctica.AAC.1